MAWRKPGENLLLHSRIERTDGTLVEQFGPLADSKFVLIGLRKPQGETWWIEFERSGDIRFLFYSPANSDLLLVGHPSSPLPSIDTRYIAVQFMSGTNTHVGWIQFNRFEVFRGVQGMSTAGSPFLNFFDQGYASAPGTPSIMGADSSLPLFFRLHPVEPNPPFINE